MRLVFDIETSKPDYSTGSIYPDTFFLLVAKDIDTQEVHSFRDVDLAVEFLMKADVLIGHNIVGYDGPVLRNFNRKFDLLNFTVYDTFIMSQMFFPKISSVGGSRHGLAAWGTRLNFAKIKFDDFTHYSEEMLRYCIRDVDVTEALFKERMQSRTKGHEDAIQLENEFAYLITLNNPLWKINKDTLREHIDFLRDAKHETEDKLSEIAPLRVIPVGKTVSPTIKSGLPSAMLLKDSAAGRVDADEVFGEYSRVDIEQLNLNSSEQVKSWLLSIGWKPDTFTYETDDDGRPMRGSDGKLVIKNPSLTKSSYNGVPSKIADKLKFLRVVSHRLNTMKGWLNRSHGDYLEAGMMTCAAATGRVQHHNIVNIPKADDDLFFGKEMRSVFGVDDKHIMLGVDLDQIEAKLQGHFTSKYDGGEWADFLLNNDIHEFNAKQWDLSRAKSKGPEYAMCVPLDTRCLTRRGWKTYDQLIIGEEVLGYNQETGLKEWTKLRKVNVTEGEVIDFGHARKRFQATRNHRWFVKQRKRSYSDKSWGLTNGRYMVDVVKTTDELNTESNIVLNAPFNTEQDQVCLQEGFEHKYKTDWCRRVLNMSHNERLQFVQGFLLADGWCTNKGTQHTWHWSQVGGEIYEGLLLASYLVHDGQIHSSSVTNPHNVSRPVNTVTLSKKGHITCQKLTKRSLGVQPVWCPTTDLGSWVMRQGDQISITGNSYGCTPSGLAEKFDFDDETAQEVFNNYWEVRKALKALKQDIEDCLVKRNQLHRGKLKGDSWIKSLDGRHISLDSKHSIINRLIQSSATIIAKRWTVLVLKYIRRNIDPEFIDTKLLIFMHDEMQLQTTSDKLDQLKEYALRAAEMAGKEFSIAVPITASANVGQNWKETH